MTGSGWYHGVAEVITDMKPGDLVVVKACYGERIYTVLSVLVHPEMTGDRTRRLPNGTTGLILGADYRNPHKFDGVVRILVGEKIYQIAVDHLQICRE